MVTCNSCQRTELFGEEKVGTAVSAMGLGSEIKGIAAGAVDSLAEEQAVRIKSPNNTLINFFMLSTKNIIALYMKFKI